MNINNDPAMVAEDYYDSNDANNFYHHIWGGEDIHVGIYLSEAEDIATASSRTVQRLAEQVKHKLQNGARVLDLGAGFGGAARQLAKGFDCHVTCLNISQQQNRLNSKQNRQANIQHAIEVIHGDFEKLTFVDQSFDVVWSQDAILHSGDRRRVMDEVFRVLSNGGSFVFTDPMQKHGVSSLELNNVLERIHLDSLSSIEGYQSMGVDAGFSKVKFHDYTPHLKTHYQRVLDVTQEWQEKMLHQCSQKYITNMKQGLQHWIDAAQGDLLRWGIFHFVK